METTSQVPQRGDRKEFQHTGMYSTFKRRVFKTCIDISNLFLYFIYYLFFGNFRIVSKFVQAV
jgi:hypothetical protein